MVTLCGQSRISGLAETSAEPAPNGIQPIATLKMQRASKTHLFFGSILVALTVPPTMLAIAAYMMGAYVVAQIKFWLLPKEVRNELEEFMGQPIEG